MHVGIGLPNALPGTTGDMILSWAQAAEGRGFSTLATVDRIVYSNVEPLIALTAAAAVTSRIGLFTDILLAPVRLPAVLAKEAASLDVISGGRLTLGLAPGARADDFTATGMRFSDRGRRFDQALQVMQSTWRGETLPGLGRPIGPAPPRGDIPVLIGGMSPQAIARVARVGAGYTAGSAAAGSLGTLIARVLAAWDSAGRQGRPSISMLTFFALGDEVAEAAAANLRDYYGEQRAVQILDRLPRDAAALPAYLDGLEQVGVTEVVFIPAAADLSQLERLADAVL